MTGESIIIEVDQKRDITPSSSSSIDDENRKELLWKKREETVVNGWRDDCMKRSNLHEKKGKLNKIKFAVFSIPSILIPIMLGGLSSIIPSHSLPYSIGMMGVGVQSGISMFFNFGKKEASHFEYMNRFFEL